MFNSYWSSNQGFSPFSPFQSTSGAFQTTLGSSSGSCYNPNLRTGYQYICSPSTSAMKLSVQELRNYVLNLEANRKLEDLNDVEFNRPVQDKDVMYYNTVTGHWELTDYLTGGQW